MKRVQGAAPILWLLSIIVAIVPMSANADQEGALEHRDASIMSDGVRLAADVYVPRDDAKKSFPTIIMSHGWGGTSAMLRGIAEDFARAGYLVVAFDYRGWGRSAGRLVASGEASAKPNGSAQPFDARVTELREVVDPIEQATDILNVIHWAFAEPKVDRERIGLWGTSFSGGLVVHVAARDSRVKALVSQVGYMGGVAAGPNGAQQAQRLYEQGAKRARGDIGYPPPGVREVGNLYGAPIWEKFLLFNAADDAARAPHCAMMFIVAEKEELFSNRDHAELAHAKHTGTKKYVSIPGIAHYGIYGSARPEATRLAIEWFDLQLKR